MLENKKIILKKVRALFVMFLDWLNLPLLLYSHSLSNFIGNRHCFRSIGFILCGTVITRDAYQTCHVSNQGTNHDTCQLNNVTSPCKTLDDCAQKLRNVKGELRVVGDSQPLKCSNSSFMGLFLFFFGLVVKVKIENWKKVQVKQKHPHSFVFSTKFQNLHFSNCNKVCSFSQVVLETKKFLFFL